MDYLISIDKLSGMMQGLAYSLQHGEYEAKARLRELQQEFRNRKYKQNRKKDTWL